MAQVKISALTAADPLTGIEEAPLVQGGATKKATTEQIRAYVASQPNVFSVTQTIESAAPALRFSENDTVDQNWEFIGVAGALRLDELDDAFATTGTHHTFTHGGGTQFGSPTGGDQGAGTVNATGLYENGTGVAKLSGGADANFTAMPQVGGDPIVESDSNADGEFTRWADGTQECRNSPFAITFNTDAVIRGDWTFPAGFVSKDSITMALVWADNAQNVTPSTNEVTSPFYRKDSSASTKDNALIDANRLPGGTNFVSGDTRDAAVSAFGAWK